MSTLTKNQLTSRLICSELTKAFGNQIGIADVNIDVEFKGLGLLGPNGSGKTTLIKMLLGIISPTSGSIEINVPVEEMRVVSDQPVLPDSMTIDEWVFTLEEIYGQHIQGIDLQTDLGLEGQWKLKNLSAGQRRKVALLPAFYGTPGLIILDEPSNYLDISTREYVLKLLKRHCHNTNANVIISSHNVDEIRMFASDVMLLKEGRLMRHIRLDNELPEFFSVKAADNQAFAEELDKEFVYYYYDNTIQGEIVKAIPTHGLWLAIEQYMQKGGNIYSLKGIDALEHMIEELTK